MSGDHVHDILIVGGGINGCGIARDAVGRGYSVYLAEMNDLASGTSSGSTKLVHGGLRYLEYYEFRLVREALAEREVLLRSAPHIIWPMRFVIPHVKGIRPAWLVRLGLFLYDHIGGRRILPPTRTLDMRSDPAGKPLKPGFSKAFEYSDCWVNDARLVILNALDAAERGATIHTRAKVVEARRTEDGLWRVKVAHGPAGAVETVKARLLVNAAGPWVDKVLSGAIGTNDVHNVRLVKGSHIVVRQKFSDPRAYFFQNRDRRIIFAIPYEDEFTLIGTTDEDFPGDPGNVEISDQEIDYLCEAASEYFAEPVTRSDIVWTYSGVRPLYDDGATKAQEATRDYVLRTEAGDGRAPLVNIFGGKITTYRRLAEMTVERIGDLIGSRGGRWTAGSTLPGGDFPVEDYEGEVVRLRERHPTVESALAHRLVRLYGTRAEAIVAKGGGGQDLGQRFGADLTEVEVRHLIESEWAMTAEDVLWRRTKLGLRVGAEDVARLEEFMRGVPRQESHQAAE